jgi:serine/threonine protein phosphatase PrpC
VAQLRLEASQEGQMPENQQAVLEYEAAGASDQGRTRKSNEDAYGLSLRNSEGACNFVVCDGMGGAAAGEVASRLAVDAMLRAMDEGVLTLETFQHAVDAANHSVHRSAAQDPSRAGMGTTLVAMATRGNRAWVAHVGDSRCYRLRDSKLERLTHDHSLVDEQVRLGQLTPAQAETSPMRNVITRAVGTQDEVDADLIEFVVMPGDLYLLASDGLMREVNDEQIAAILRRATDRSCQRGWRPRQHHVRAGAGAVMSAPSASLPRHAGTGLMTQVRAGPGLVPSLRRSDHLRH